MGVLLCWVPILTIEVIITMIYSSNQYQWGTQLHHVMNSYQHLYNHSTISIQMSVLSISLIHSAFMDEGHFDLTVSHYRYFLPSLAVIWSSKGGGVIGQLHTTNLGSCLLLVREGEIFVNSVSHNTEHEKRSIDWGSSRFNNTMSTMAWDAYLPITILEVYVQLLTAPYQLWKTQKKLLFVYFQCNLSPPLSFPYIYIYTHTTEPIISEYFTKWKRKLYIFHVWLVI